MPTVCRWQMPWQAMLWSGLQMQGMLCTYIVYIYTCVCVCVIYLHVCIYMYICTHIYTCVCVCECVCMYCWKGCCAHAGPPRTPNPLNPKPARRARGGPGGRCNASRSGGGWCRGRKSTNLFCSVHHTFLLGPGRMASIMEACELGMAQTVRVLGGGLRGLRLGCCVLGVGVSVFCAEKGVGWCLGVRCGVCG